MFERRNIFDDPRVILRNHIAGYNHASFDDEPLTIEEDWYLKRKPVVHYVGPKNEINKELGQQTKQG